MSLRDQIIQDQKEVFLNTDDFATSVKLVSLDRNIIANFKIEGDTIELMGDHEVVQPMLKCDATDVIDVKNRDAILIEATTYYVKRKEPKGTAKVHLYLSLDPQ